MDEIMEPRAAIHRAIYDLYHERDAWKDRDDPHGVREEIAARIVALEQAKRDLAELRRLFDAPAVLGIVVPAREE